MKRGIPKTRVKVNELSKDDFSLLLYAKETSYFRIKREKNICTANHLQNTFLSVLEKEKSLEKFRELQLLNATDRETAKRLVRDAS